MAELTRAQELKVAIYDILEKQSVLNNKIRALDEEKQSLLVELQQVRMGESVAKPSEPKASVNLEGPRQSTVS